MLFLRYVLAVTSALLLTVPADAAQAPARPAAKSKPAKPTVRRTTEFDGRYSGAMTVTPVLSGPGCHDVQVQDFVINGGVIVPATVAASLQPVFDGFVTDDGFITGHVRMADSVIAFEGRAEPQGMVKVISGGVLDDAAKCSWVVNLTLE
ncbi:MAG: hypothetical protein ACYCZX_20260 [Rhodospirillaceae bacterium]